MELGPTTRARPRRDHLVRFSLGVAALAAAVLLAASPASASGYGGLGQIGESLIKSGSAGGHGEVNKEGGHAFAVDAANGDMFVADLYTEPGTKNNFARIQELGPPPASEFLAENRIQLHNINGFSYETVGGLAVDQQEEKVYLLLDEERESELVFEEEKLEPKKETLERKEEAEQKKPSQQLEEEIETLKNEIKAIEEQLPLFDPEIEAAARLFSFDVAANANKELKKHEVVGKAALEPTSTTGKPPLLDPTGIALDPTTHDILIAGQQDEAPNTEAGRGEGATAWRAVVQRVHANGMLGPRYVDTTNCLDGGEATAGESTEEKEACESESEALPNSPIVTSGGKVFVDRGGSQVWEMPASTDASEEFTTVEAVKRVTTMPQHLLTLSEGIFGGLTHEESGALTYSPVVSSTPGVRQGHIFMDAKPVPDGGNNGVVELAYSEPEVEAGANVRKLRELGWTGGEGTGGKNPKCVLSGNATLNGGVLLAAGKGGEEVFALTSLVPAVWEYGPGGEACGDEPKVSPPKIEVGSSPVGVSKIGAGEPAELSSQVEGAQATEVDWTFKHVNQETGQPETETVESGYEATTAPDLAHTFAEPGSYEVIEKVQTDDLGFPTVTAQTVKLEVTGVKAVLAQVEGKAQEELTFEAELEDQAESPAHFKVVWNFGDGTPPVSQTYEGASVARVGHAFASPGDYQVTLEVTDGSGKRKTTVVQSASIAESLAEEQARVAHELEVHQQQVHAREVQEQEVHAREASEAKARAEAEAKARAEAEAKKHQEELEKDKTKPLTRVQLLNKALKLCQKQHNAHKRAKCEAAAHKKYGPKHTAKKKHKK
ncbi:MAG TPA: PKD domain-containing protein [Solirubrobacteraceae bacterium]|nr:PKD domain-containing protein [Solirubrobacteraceae bacterium]